jgi:hypothetical protein
MTIRWPKSFCSLGEEGAAGEAAAAGAEADHAGGGGPQESVPLYAPVLVPVEVPVNIVPGKSVGCRWSC